MRETKEIKETAEMQDGKVMSKLGIRKNKLVAKYGTNYILVGKVKNGLDRVTVVMSIPIPRFGNIKVKLINFVKCTIALETDSGEGKSLTQSDTQASKAAKEWCARATPYIEYLRQQEKYYIERVHNLLCEDLYSALPEYETDVGPLKGK